MSKLTLSNVSYFYQNAEKPAVDRVTYTFQSGLLYVIVGPSGSGKSTLLSLLAGLDAPAEGEILFDDTSLGALDLDRYRREDVTMIFQSYQLFPLMTALENACYPMELQGITPKEARPQAALFLESVGITPVQMTRYPSRLSGGEQQRVAIARSLASGARIMIADEPTGNLDVENSKMIVAILAELARKKEYCVIIVTHDMDVAKEADVVLRMVDGTLLDAQG